MYAALIHHTHIVYHACAVFHGYQPPPIAPGRVCQAAAPIQRLPINIIVDTVGLKISLLMLIKGWDTALTFEFPGETYTL